MLPCEQISFLYLKLSIVDNRTDVINPTKGFQVVSVTVSFALNLFRFEILWRTKIACPVCTGFDYKKVKSSCEVSLINMQFLCNGSTQSETVWLGESRV